MSFANHPFVNSPVADGLDHPRGDGREAYQPQAAAVQKEIVMSVHANEQWKMASIIGPVWSSGLDSGSQVPPATTDDAPSAEAMPSAATPAAESYEVLDATGKRIPFNPEQQARVNQIWKERADFQRKADAGEKTARELQVRLDQIQDEIYRTQQAARTAPAAPARPGERILPPELQKLLDHPEWGPIFNAQWELMKWYLQPISETTKRLQEEREIASIESQHAVKRDAEIKAYVQIQQKVIKDIKLPGSYTEQQIEDLAEWAVNRVAHHADQEHWEQLPPERQRALFEMAFRQQMQEKAAMWPAGKKPASISPDELENAIPAGEIVPGATGVMAPDSIMEDLREGKIGAGEAIRLKTKETLKTMRRNKGA